MPQAWVVSILPSIDDGQCDASSGIIYNVQHLKWVSLKNQLEQKVLIFILLYCKRVFFNFNYILSQASVIAAILQIKIDLTFHSN